MQTNREDSLRRLEISVNDLVQVKVVHAACDAGSPVHQHPGRHFPPGPQHLIQLALCTVLHDDAVARCLRAHAPGLDKTQEMSLRDTASKQNWNSGGPSGHTIININGGNARARGCGLT